MSYTQENRLIAIDTPLGKDVLLLEGFRGMEGISLPFQFDLDLVSLNHNIVFNDIIAKNVTVSVVLEDGNRRYFNGVISRFSQGRGVATQKGDPFTYYHATMVPWFWLLTRTSDSRIFQNVSVADIVDDLFKEKHKKYNFGNIKLDYRTALQAPHDKWDYCVQYRETDFNFISRLLEEEGIYYFFEHEDGKHTMVLADSPREHKPCPNKAKIRYRLSAGTREEEDMISELEKTQEIRPGEYTLNEFNFEIPSTDLKVNVPGKQKLAPGKREVYTFPGVYEKRNEGDRLVKIRMEEEEAQITTITGASDCRVFTSGYKFTLSDHFRNDMNDKDYVLTSVSHQAHQDHTSEAGLSYVNRFACIPFDVPYRPPRHTPIPFVQGSQTAIVVGPKGEEIYTDKYGRVKVQFHWDREGKKDENSSCWVRVAQLWAGENWGAMFIPRIGQEVIVEFLEGDPDRPIITGRVYHGTNMPPYPLPAQKTKSTIKSNSSMGGGGFNELRFEDKKGSEEVFIHAQKDENIVVNNNQTIAVGNDRAESIIRDRSLKVGRDKSELVGRNKTVQVVSGHTEQIGMNMTIMVGSTLTETVGINYAETVGGAMELSVGGALAVTVGAAIAETTGGAKIESVGMAKSQNIGANKSVNVGKDSTENIGSNKTVTVSKNLDESVGGQHTESVAKEFILNARKVQIVAQDEISIKTGQAEMLLKKNGDITIKGKKISVNGSGDVIIKGSKISEN